MKKENRGIVRLGARVSGQESLYTGRRNMCTHVNIYLLYSEWGADLLPSEYYGSLSQDLRQLEGIQAQQLTGISDHCKHGIIRVSHLHSTDHSFNLLTHFT